MVVEASAWPFPLSPTLPQLLSILLVYAISDIIFRNFLLRFLSVRYPQLVTFSPRRSAC